MSPQEAPEGGVREISNTWIRMSDGVHLAARVWMPEDAVDQPVPAILEYLPYRKSDWTAERDEAHHRWFAAHGYAGVRVDIRGTGDSEGIITDEYPLSEQEDGIEVLSWLAEQPWCDGNVGMIGISWGGFNGLQIAAHRPPELKAVITVASTDDRYADDVHYMGGCVLGAEMMPWSATMLALDARPPDPAVVGERWRDMWLDRLSKTPAFVDEWLAHQHRDDYWKHGSINEDYDAVEVPVLAVSGWHDPYRNSIPRMLAGLPGVAKGLIGPWAHTYPNRGKPGPAVGFLEECRRWWDQYLKGIDRGVESDPALRAYMVEDDLNAEVDGDVRGRWVVEDTWPSPRITSRTLALDGDFSLRDEPERPARLEISTPQHTGVGAGTWCAHGRESEFPLDQRADDGRSVTFDTDPLGGAVEILGYPKVRVRLTSDRPVALLAARLLDVAPDGKSTLVTRGLLNLTHRESHEKPSPLEPGEPFEVELSMSMIGYRFAPGHRIRLALSNTYWPWAWPSPEPVSLEFDTGAGAHLELPERPREDEPVGELFGPPVSAVAKAAWATETPRSRRRFVVEPEREQHSIEHVSLPLGAKRVVLNDEVPLDEHVQNTTTFNIKSDDPLSAEALSSWTVTQRRGDWEVRIEAESTMRADAERFHLAHRVVAWEGSSCVSDEAWSTTVPRDLV